MAAAAGEREELKPGLKHGHKLSFADKGAVGAGSPQKLRKEEVEIHRMEAETACAQFQAFLNLLAARPQK